VAVPLELENLRVEKIQSFEPEVLPNVLSDETLCTKLPVVLFTVPEPVIFPLTVVVLISPVDNVPFTARSPVKFQAPVPFLKIALAPTVVFPVTLIIGSWSVLLQSEHWFHCLR
jgi:hypothetical protein